MYLCSRFRNSSNHNKLKTHNYAKNQFKNLTCKGIEITSFKMQSYLIHGERFDYTRSINAYIFYYNNIYILYTYIIHSPIIREYDTLEEAYLELSRFITNIANPSK